MVFATGKLIGLGAVLVVGAAACVQSVVGYGIGGEASGAALVCDTPPELAGRGEYGDDGFGPIPPGCVSGMPQVEICGETVGTADFQADDTHYYWLRIVQDSPDPDGAVFGLVRAPKGGGAPEEIVTIQGYIDALGMDAQRIWWSLRTPGANGSTIRSVPKGGGPVEDLHTFPEGVAALTFSDPEAIFAVVYQDIVGTGDLVALPKSGGPLTVLAAGVPAGIAAPLVDAERVYWMSEAAISSAPRGGGPATVLVDNPDLVNDWLLVMDDTRLYWPHGNGVIGALGTLGAIDSVAKTGGPVTRLYQTDSTPWALAVDGACLYWPQTGKDGKAILLAMAKSGGTPARLDAWQDTTVVLPATVVDGDGLYLASLNVGPAPSPTSAAPAVPPLAGKMVKFPRP